MSGSTPRAELARAVRRVNAIYKRAGEPESVQLDGPAWDLVEAAVASGDSERARQAIAAWESLCIDCIEGARR